MKINARHHHLLFSLLMSMIVALIVTCVLTAVNQGYTNFLLHWMHSFSIAWVVAFISVLVIAPRMNQWVKRMTAE